MKKFFNWLLDIFTIHHDCPKCKIELDAYSHDIHGHRFYYVCPICKYKEPEYDER